MWTRIWPNPNLDRQGIQMKPSGSKSAIALGWCLWVRKWLDPDLDRKVSNEAIWKHICNGFGDVHAKRGVGQLADALIRFDLSKQARQARQARQRSGQKPGRCQATNQTLHLCMFQRPRAIKHYTCACLSACGAPNITHMQIRALKSHLDRQWHSESTFGHGCTVPEFEKRRTKAHLYTVARFQNVTWLRGCTVPEFGPEGMLAMIPIISTKPK